MLGCTSNCLHMLTQSPEEHLISSTLCSDWILAPAQRGGVPILKSQIYFKMNEDTHEVLFILRWVSAQLCMAPHGHGQITKCMLQTLADMCRCEK